MGQCLSHEAAGGHFPQNRVSHSTKNASPRLRWSGLRGRHSTRRSKPKLTIMASGEYAHVQPPLTGRTATETPEAVVMGSSSFEPNHDSSDGLLLAEEELIHIKSGRLSLGNIFSSMQHTEHLHPIIPEEVDPAVPSDEECEDERLHQQALKRKPSSPKRTPSGVSPPRPQSRIKMRHQRITRPSSVVHHEDTPDPPSRSSVSRHTISQFNRLKVQVKLAKRQQRKEMLAAKLEDRYQDVQGYKKLWENFSEIQDKVANSSPPRLKRSNSFDLHDTSSWFVDFQSCDEGEYGFYDSDDDMSQSSLSLHSATSLESQRRYFKEKRERRLSRRRSEPNLCLTSRSVTSMQAAPQSIRFQKKDETNHKKPLEVSSKRRSPTQRIEQFRSTTPKISQSGFEDETPSDIGTAFGAEWDESFTPNVGRGRLAPTLNVIESATGKPDYHVYREMGDISFVYDEVTPKASVRSRMWQTTDTGKLDINNDYQVPRRRRVASFDEAGIPFSANAIKDTEFLGIKRSAPPLGYVEYSSSDNDTLTNDFRPDVRPLRKSPNKATTFDGKMRDLKNPSSATDTVTTARPNLRVMRTSPNVGTMHASRREKVVHGKATISAGVVNNRGSEKKRAVNNYKAGESFKPSILTMSTEEFYSFSDDHVLVNMSQMYGHESSYEDSPRRPDFDADTEGARSPEDIKKNTVPDDECAADACTAKYQGVSPRLLDFG